MCTLLSLFGGDVYRLNNVYIKLATARNVSGDFRLCPSCIALYSPIDLRKSNKAYVDVNSQVDLVISMVGIVNLQRAKIFPIAVRDNIGEMQGLTPPSRSDSARLKQMRSS